MNSISNLLKDSYLPMRLFLLMLISLQPPKENTKLEFQYKLGKHLPSMIHK